VTVNPKDSQNLIMAGTAQKKHATLPFVDSVAICPLGVSFDAGRTWRLEEIPLGRVAGTSEDTCYDGFTGADRGGTLYAGGNILPHSADTGNVRLVRVNFITLASNASISTLVLAESYTRAAEGASLSNFRRIAVVTPPVSAELFETRASDSALAHRSAHSRVRKATSIRVNSSETFRAQ
jgi:hypothetical protein